MPRVGTCSVAAGPQKVHLGLQHLRRLAVIGRGSHRSTRLVPRCQVTAYWQTPAKQALPVAHGVESTTWL